MKITTSLVAAALCAVASAQSPLNCFPVQPAGYFGWNTPPPITTNLFNLTVSSQVTLQALSTPLLTAVGTTGTLEVWLTNPGITTYVGNETNPASWTQAASGIITGNGTTGSLASLTATSCQSIGGAGLVLNPGSYGVMLRFVGVNPLLTAVAVSQTFSNTELSVSGGALQYTPFTAPVGPQTTYTAWQWRGSIIYQPGVFPHACAEAVNYGNGCNTVGGSAYQEWTDSTPGGAAPSASLALTGRQLAFIPAGQGYVMVPGTSVFIPPTAAAVALPPLDDAEATITPTQPFPTATSLATQLFVHSNGFVSLGSNQTLPGGPNDIPEIPQLLNAPATAWWSWHDFNPAEAGSGQIVWEEIGALIVITWQDVESYPAPAVNRSTIQFQFDTSLGSVTILWQTVDAVGGSGFLQQDDWLIGYSPGGPSPMTGSFNIATLTSQVLPAPEVFPLRVTATSKPLLGTTFDLVTSGETGLSLGICFVGAVQFPAPGFGLSVLGMPGCVALVDINTAVGNVISNLGLPGTSMTIAFPLPPTPTLAGVQVFSQSIWLDAAANPFGATTSNGIALTVGNF